MGLADAGAAAREVLSPLRLGEVKPEGWLRAQLKRDLESGYQGHLDDLLQEPGTGRFLLKPEHNDFVARARNRNSGHDDQGRALPPQPHCWWDGEMIGDWHDGLIRAAFLVDDAQARKKADDYVKAILKSQDADGYIGIYPAGFRFRFAAADAELWTQRCVLLGLLAYYEFSGRQDVLAAVERAVKLTIRQYDHGDNYFENPRQSDNGVAHGLMFLDVLEWLYRLKGDDAYRRAALALYEGYNTAEHVRNKDAQLANLLDPKTPFAGHGPDVMGFLRVPLLCYYLSGKETFWEAWQNSMLKTERHLGVGGSPLSGQGEEIAQQARDPGLPYEYCSTFYLLHSLTWAIQKTGKGRYGDLLERTLFNAAQGARFPNGKALTYYSADERLWVRQNPPEGSANRRFIYTAAYYPCCCHDSGARVYPYAISSMWMRSRSEEGEGLVATLYGPSHVATTLNGVAVQISERTGYPFSFDITFTVNPETKVRFPLRLRVPAWSGEPVVSGSRVAVSRDENGFLVLIREWKRGDTVRLRLKPVIAGQKAVNGTTALTYGPLVFCFPMPERAEIVERFPAADAAGLKGFCGYQYDPADVARAKRALKLQADVPGFGFKVVQVKSGVPLDPWDNPLVEMRGNMLDAIGSKQAVVLLPMGSTILRRICFPLHP